MSNELTTREKLAALEWPEEKCLKCDWAGRTEDLIVIQDNKETFITCHICGSDKIEHL